VTPSPQGEGREAPYHFGQVPCCGRGFAPCPPYVIPTERKRAEGSPGKNAFSLGDFSACGLEMTEKRRRDFSLRVA